MQLVHCACIFRGQVRILQYTVAVATMILFSLQCDKLFLAKLRRPERQAEPHNYTPF